MIQHLVHRPVNADLRKREDAEHAESKMAYRRVGHQLLHVRLHECDQGSVNDADKRKNVDPQCMFMRLSREERGIEPQKSIRTHFQQHAGEKHRTCSRSLDVRVWQPGMEWK